MQLEDRGAGRFKGFIALVIIAAIIFFAVKMAPVLVEEYELQDYIRGLAVDVTVQFPPATVDGVKGRILYKARHLGLPVKKDDITVVLGHTVSISVDYHVPVNLEFYTLDLHFTPSAQNNKLL